MTWNNLAHEGGTFAAAIIAIACIAYLTRNWSRRKRDSELLARGIATGLVPQQIDNAQKRRFSLLDLLVCITLLAALAGLFVGMWNEERDGIPRFRLWKEIKRQSEHANK